MELNFKSEQTPRTADFHIFTSNKTPLKSAVNLILFGH